MKKSQSIFLLSGLVPLVAAPIAIVASCSSDNTTTTSQNAQDEVKRLNELITSSKFKIKDGTTFDQAQIDELKKTPDKLLTDYLDKTELKLDENKFTYNVETDGFSVTPPTDNTKDGTINFKIKVTNKTTTTETATTNAATVAYKPSNQTSPTNPLLDEAVKKIQDAHSAQTFKLKDAKKTMTEADVTKLTADPNLLLKTEFTDGFPALEQGLTASVNKTNFSIVDKKQAQGTTKTIQFKVTVTDAQKTEKDTQQLTFDFTLQAAASVTANSIKEQIEQLEANGTFKLKDAKKTLPKAEVDQLSTKATTFLNEYTDGLTLDSNFTYAVEGLKVEDTARQGTGQQTTKYIKFTIKVTNNQTTTETAKTKEFS